MLVMHSAQCLEGIIHVAIVAIIYLFIMIFLTSLGSKAEKHNLTIVE
jgi:hypothetical protein